jgi:hypothetical protein
MRDQPSLFDLPDPVPPRPPTRSGRGRARETFARTVVADVSVYDAGALRAKASRALDHSVVIGGAADTEDGDLLDPREEISTARPPRCSGASSRPWAWDRCSSPAWSGST